MGVMATILLTGDVMLGRGIDQILGQSNTPELYEPFACSALTYVALAEARSGPIPSPVPCHYVWGDALAEFRASDLRIVNLETALTCAAQPAPKGINYRCHPGSIGCLTAAGIDCCVLANNHVLDWGEAGLVDTLEALTAAGLAYAGAGHDEAEAEAPAILPLPGGGRVLVHALGSPTSGVPRSWAAAAGRPGVHLLDDHDLALERLTERIAAEKQPRDIVLVSIHWGPNWDYDIPLDDQLFARKLIAAGADIVHGHSSHHPKAAELYRGRAILYGCGDFLNDYEGISGHDAYRPNLVLAWRVTLEPDGCCGGLELLPFRIARFRLARASAEEAEWLAATMDRECRRFGGSVELEGAALRFAATAEVH